MNMTIDEQAGPKTAVFTGFNAERSELVDHSVDLENLDEAGYGALFNAGRDGFFSAEGAATPMARFEDQTMFREGWDPREKAEKERVDAVSKKAEVLFLDMKDPQVKEKAKLLHGAAFVDDFVNLSEEDRKHVAVRFVKDSVYGAGDDGYGRMAAEYGLPYSMSDAEWFSVLGGKLKETHAERQRVEALQEQVKKENARVGNAIMSGESVDSVYESISGLDPEVQVEVYKEIDFARQNRAKTDDDIRAFLDDVFPEKSVAVGMEGLKNEAWRPSDLNDLTLKLVDLRKKNEWAYRDVMRLIQEGADHVKENAYEGESLESKYKKQGLITPLDALEKAGFLRQIGANLRNIAGSAFDMALPYYDEESGNQEISGFWDYLTSSGASWDVLTNWNPLDVNAQSKLPMTKYLAEHYGKNDGMKKLSQEEMAVRNDLLGKVRDLQTSSTRKDLFYGEWRDKLAQGVASTLAFQASPWLIFGSSTNDRMDELIADGSSGGNALLRGMLSGGVDVGSEFMFGIGKVTRWGGPRAGKLFKEVAQTKAVQAALKYPLALKAATGRAFRLNKLWGYASGAKIAWSRAHYGSAMLRYGVATGRAGLGEMVEEYAGILAGVPGDYYLAMMLGEDNATGLMENGERRTLSGEVWKQCGDLTMDTGTWFSMMAMGGLFAGANLGRYRRDAMWMTTKPKNLQAMGLTEEQAVEVANTVKPEEKFQLGRKYLADNQRKSVDELMQNVRVGFTSMDQDMEWVEDLAGYEDAVESGMLPRAERMEDGKWKMTMRVRNEAGELVEAAPLMLDDKTATGYMQTLFENEFMRGELLARDNMVANAMVDKLKTDENWKVRDMGQADTQESMERLAVMARMRMDKAAADGKYMVSQIVDPSVDADLTLGQAERMGEAFGERVKLEKLRDADKLSRERSLMDEARLAAGQERFTNEEWDSYADRHIYSSAANRTRIMDSGKTLLRYAAGEIGAMDVMEEVIEDEFERSKRDGRSLGWWAGHFRALQKEMGMPNTFLPDSGNVTEAQVTEAVSKMVKSDLLARSETLNISDWLKAFLRMLARMMRRAHALCKLGKMFNDLHAAGKLNKDFVRSIHEFTGKTAEYFKDLQVKTAADVHGKAVAAASTAYAAPALKEMGLAPAAAEAEDGMEAMEPAAAPAPEEDAVVQDMATAVQEEVNAQGIEGARRAKDPLAMAAAVREAGLDEAGLKAHGLTSGTLGKAARVGSLAGDGLYRAVLAGDVPMKSAERLASTAPRNEDLQKVGMEELERGVKAAVATMQATAALGEGATREEARRAAEYVQRKMRALEKRLVQESDAMNEDFDPDMVMHLKESIEQVRNWPAFREVVELARAWDGKSRVDGSPLATAGTTFSLNADGLSSADVSAAWERKLSDYLEGRNGRRTADMKVCPTPSVLQMLGAKAHDMVITPAVIDKVLHGRHAVPVEELKRLPVAMQAPLAVFESATQGGSMVALTELKEGEHNIVVAVHLEASSAESQYSFKVNRVASLYGKENARALWNTPLLYLDMKKARPWLVSHGLQLPGQPRRTGSKSKIHTPADIVKWKERQGLPGTTFSVRFAERESIVEQAQNAGTYLKAPNGEASNLSPEQWVTVRTEAFKRWFGDWENDADNASKVVDENGEPLCVYHGTRQGGFTVFDTWGEGDSEGSGSFFTSKSNVAGGYSDKSERGMYAVFLNMRNPLIQDFEGNRWDSVPGRPSGYFVETEDGESEWYGNREDAEYALESAGEGATIVEDYADDGSESNFTLNDLAREARDEGYDGVIARRVFDPSIRAEAEEHAVADDFVIFEPEQIKSSTDNSGAFDGGNPDITFSVRGDFGMAEELLVPSQKVRGHEVLTRTIHEDIQRCIELWNRYDNLAADEREKAIVAIGSAMHLAQAVAGSLPSKYRFSLNPYLKKMQVFSELAATGDLDFTRDLASQKIQNLDELRGKFEGGSVEEMVKEYGEKKLNEVVADLLRKTDERLNRWGRDCVIVEIDRLLDRVKPQVDSRTMRQKKGLLSAAGYRRLQEIDKLMGYTQEQKEEALGVLEGAVQKAKDAGTAAELADAEDRLAELAMFGALHDMTMEQAAAAHSVLSDFIQKERFAWDEVRDMRQARTRRILGKAIRLFGGRPSFNAVNLAKHRKSTLKDAMTMDGILLSMPHIMQQLRKYPALEGLAGLMQARQAAAFQGIAASRRQRVEQVHALAKQYLGKKNWKAMNRLKEVHKTGISLQRIRMERVEIASQMVDVWLNKTPEERESYRQEQEEAAAKADEKPTVENMERVRTIPTERDVEELARWRKERDAREAVYRRELNEYEKATDEMRRTMKKPRPPKADNQVRLEYEGEMETVENFETSKDTALYIILMSEQAEYASSLARQGFDAETIGKLKEWIGQDVLEFGYGLRKLFKEQGEKIAVVYEATYGVPFPRVENYFAARFDVARMKSAEAEILQGMGAMQGGGKGFMKVRTFHNHDLDLRRGALSVFMEATEISDNWMFTQDIVSDWRAFLSDQDFANVLAVHLGEELYERLRRWVSMIETMGVRGAMSLGAADRVIGKLYGAKANSVLGFKLETMLRQTSAVLNGWAGDPSIGFSEWMKAIAMIRGKKTPMTVEKMLASPEMRTRFGGQLGLAERQMMLPTGEKANAVESMLQAGMSPMEYIDMRLNAMSMTAVYYVHYNRAKAKGMSEADCDLAGWAGVHGSIDMAAQPQNWMQKSELWNRLPAIAKPVLFMMSENINKAGLCLSLFRSGQYKKSAQVWFAYGILNTLVGILLDFIRDDPDEWEKRDWLGYVFAAAFGPLNGIPIVGEMLETGVDYLLKLANIDMGVYVGSAGRGVVDLGGTRRAVEKMLEMMAGDKEGDFGEYVKQSIRLSSSVGVIGGAFGGTVGSAMLLGSALMNPVKTVTNFIHSRGWDD